MDTLTVEYAILIDGRQNFCDSEITFLNFLSANSKFKFNTSESTIDYLFSSEDSISVIYHISLDETIQQDKLQQRFFRVAFTYQPSRLNDSELESFAAFIQEFKSSIHNLEIDIYALHNDISSHYSRLAYPKINEIENLLRKLILRFFLKSTGSNWLKETLNREEIKKGIKAKQGSQNSEKERRQEESRLHEIDFIELSTLLTTPFRSLSTEKLYEMIGEVKTSDDIEIETLKSYLPKSFWTRYFADLVDYEEEKFKSKWKILYDLRCKVAHSRFIGKFEYEKILEITSELNKKFQEALERLEDVEVSVEEKEDVEYNASQIVRLVMEASKVASESIDSVRSSLNVFAKDFNALDAAKALERYANIIGGSTAHIHSPEMVERIKALTGDSSSQIPEHIKAIIGNYSPEIPIQVKGMIGDP